METKRLSQAAVARLAAIAGGTYDEGDRLSDELRDRLCEIDVPKTALRWAESRELQALDWSLQDSLDVVTGVRELAREAAATGKSLCLQRSELGSTG